MVHQGHDPQTLRVLLDGRGQAAHGEAVDHRPGTVRQLGERARERTLRGAVGVGEAAGQIVHAHATAERAHPGDDAGVVDVAARELVERPRHHELELVRRHGFPS